MSNAARLATAIAVLTMTLSAQPAAADPADPRAADVTVVDATAAQQSLVDLALDRYEAAELPIPSITIAFHDNSDGCGGNLGYYDQASQQLDMCNNGRHYKITPASTLLHELGHAWSFENMSAAERTEFTAHRGLEHWHHDGTWWHMGQEQAAEIIAWGIGGTDFASPYLGEECTQLAAGYEMLTGQQPPAQNCG